MIDMIDVLNKLEAEGLIKQAKKTGKHMMIHCPFHSDGKAAGWYPAISADPDV